MNTQIAQIQHLKQVLQSSGYNYFQVESIIMDTIDNSLEEATQEELSQLISNLEDYIKFAQKCKNIEICRNS